MSIKWIYNNSEYTSEAAVNQAVLDLQFRLNNTPTDWVVVRQLTGDAESGWIVPEGTLTDTEINNLDETSHYSVSSSVGSGSDVGLTAAETTAKVAEYRTEYAQYCRANTISTEYAPTTVDMSAYL